VATVLGRGKQSLSATGIKTVYTNGCEGKCFLLEKILTIYIRVISFASALELYIREAFMKKMTLLILVCLAALLLCAQAHANYRIELKSGRSIITSYYWEENGRIMFYQLGGVVGYPADQVERITDTDRPEPQETPRVEPDVDEESSLESGPAEQGEVEVPAELDMDTEEFQAKVEQYQEELREVRRELSLNVDIYKSNMIENNWLISDDVKDKIEALQVKQDSIRHHILQLYGEELPDWWDDITQEQ
jgi:hypothetical protein